mmetsp:Transcript_121196/g.337582  ORF Transcript_121196/g.337582 Transcript_121196/m.337582 type:complete len:212 (+) Transcript_121196:579-1214(+)
MAWSKLHSKLPAWPATPPAAPDGPQPTAKWLQHHSRFARDQPRWKLAKPAAQSKGKERRAVDVVGAAVLHAMPKESQQKAFFSSDQPRSRSENPTPQSKPGAVDVAIRQPRPNTWQHHRRRSCDHPPLDGAQSSGPIGCAGAEAACVAACVGGASSGELRKTYAQGRSTIASTARMQRHRWTGQLAEPGGGPADSYAPPPGPTKLYNSIFS